MDSTGKHAAGTPAWIDYWTSDIDGTVAFFQKVLGWDVSDAQTQYGGYRVASVGGLPIGGFGPQFPPLGHDIQFVSIATDDARAARDAATAAGGRAAMAGSDHEIMELGSNGTLCALYDNDGNLFGAWQGDQQPGFGITDKHGAPTWHELRAKDPAAAREFYSKTFGLTWSDPLSGPEFGELDYRIALVPGQEMGTFGLCAAGDGEPGWISSYWTDDLDAAHQRVTEAGGEVLDPPHPFTYGRCADYRTPAGARFGLFEPQEQEQS